MRNFWLWKLHFPSSSEQVGCFDHDIYIQLFLKKSHWQTVFPGLYSAKNPAYLIVSNKLSFCEKFTMFGILWDQQKHCSVIHMFLFCSYITQFCYYKGRFWVPYEAGDVWTKFYTHLLELFACERFWIFLIIFHLCY